MILETKRKIGNHTSSSISPSFDGLYHPANESQLIALIKEAATQSVQIRVRGSAHSVITSIFTDNYFSYQPSGLKDRGINILMDQYANILEWDEANRRVTVQAGIHFSIDPSDPSHSSTVKNGLLYQLDQKGWAIDDVGGITHQTVGGFTTNGCAGGSLSYTYMESIYQIRYIDGKGEVHTVTRPEVEDPNNEFWAFGVSMGLLGIISTITFQCIPRFFIKGQQAVTKLDECAVDLFGAGSAEKPSLKDFLYNTPYTRLEWWPQPGVNVMQVWKANRMSEQSFPVLNFQRLPYKEFGKKPLLAEVIGEFLFNWFGNATRTGFWGKVNKWLFGFLNPILTNAFNPVDPPKKKQAASIIGIQEVLNEIFASNNKTGTRYLYLLESFQNQLSNYLPQQFWDVWWLGLPMDNVVEDRYLPTKFTEIWIDIDHAAEVMQDLRAHYKAKGLEASGTFACEIYGSKASDFWMSPAYQRDVVRIDLYWYLRNDENPAISFYPQFWDLLAKYNYRLHWGKYLPTTSWRDPIEHRPLHEYLKQQYPKWDDFLALRQQRDPYNVFLTTYWSSHLGLSNSSTFSRNESAGLRQNSEIS